MPVRYCAYKQFAFTSIYCIIYSEFSKILYCRLPCLAVREGGCFCSLDERAGGGVLSHQMAHVLLPRFVRVGRAFTCNNDMSILGTLN